MNVERRHSRHSTQHLAALLPLRATADPSPPAALPGASFSGGRKGGAAGRKENSITLPVYAICPVPLLGQRLTKAVSSQLCQVVLPHTGPE